MRIKNSPLWKTLLIVVALMIPFTAIAQEADNAPQTTDEIATRMAAEETTDAPGNVTLDFKDADILLVLRLLSLKSGVNIVAGPEVEGTVTIRLHDVPWEKALDVVLRTYGYVYERDGKIIRVTTRENLAAEELVTETFVLNYSTAAEIEDAVSEIISDRGRLKAVQRTNTVIVTDIATNIYKIGEIIRRLDKRTPQVYIDSKIIETSQTNTEKLGVNWNVQGSATGAARDWSFPWKSNNESGWDSYQGGDINTTVEDGEATINNVKTLGTLSFSSLSATLNFLQSFSDTKTVSNPRIVVLSNQTAKIQVGQEIPIPNFERNESTGSMEVNGYEMRDVGIVMNVTPHVNDANEILVKLKPEISARNGEVEFGDDQKAPVFDVTTADTQLLIKSGETIAIGGLVKKQDIIARKKVPVLGDIPFIGRAFRNETRNDGGNESARETLFFVTCNVVDTKGEVETIDEEI